MKKNLELSGGRKSLK